MRKDSYEDNKARNSFLVLSQIKEKHVSYIDKIPKQYIRTEYIIDRLNCKKKNVD